MQLKLFNFLPSTPIIGELGPESGGRSLLITAATKYQPNLRKKKTKTIPRFKKLMLLI